ncbi:hypothetical protein L3C95_28295 [Chitinophaga filiformis]|uniref:hypothetical protein n=1 Tax=Chitinophaga filiformis TaxID=104663 RepID=UPI001F3DE527|nr:hypothetical protein [Chitinophaga filiformis]MCF6406832.1 hypothetical protein [Chitinophaga filiformis]
MENPKKQFTWYGSASSEAGPFMIAGVEDFAQWRGSDETLPAGFRVSYYGTFIRELSSHFQTIDPVRFNDEAGLLQFTQTLINEIYTLQPEIVMREQKKMTTAEIIANVMGTAAVDADIVTPDARQNWLNIWQERRQCAYDFFVEEKHLFHLEMDIDTDYTRICETALSQDEIAIASFGTNAQALFWDVRPNTVTLALDQTKTAVFFVTALTDVQRKKALEVATTGEAFYEVGQLLLPTGRGILAWSPMTQDDLGAPEGLSRVADLNPPVQLNSLNILKVGTLFKVQPGMYNVTCGWSRIEEDDFAWVRLDVQV